MRRIKFRVWDNILKYYVSVDGFVLGLDNELWKLKDLNVQQVSYITEVDESTFIIEQYTGLKDKNGVEIYEGDIVEYDNDRYIVHYNVKTLSYDLKDFNESNQCPLWFFSKCKIVGNIHEVDKC